MTLNSWSPIPPFSTFNSWSPHSSLLHFQFLIPPIPPSSTFNSAGLFTAMNDAAVGATPSAVHYSFRICTDQWPWPWIVHKAWYLKQAVLLEEHPPDSARCPCFHPQTSVLAQRCWARTLVACGLDFSKKTSLGLVAIMCARMRCSEVQLMETHTREHTTSPGY